MADIRYKKGKVYKLVNDKDTEIYVGSTCLPLSKRFYIHKQASKRDTNRYVYQHLNNVGFDNVRIVLIEKFPCGSKEELLQRERHWCDKLEPKLNSRSPIHSEEERKAYVHEYNKAYNLENADKIKARNDANQQYRAEHYKENKATIQEQHKQYYNDNKDKLIQARKAYYEANKEAIKEKTKAYREKNKEHLAEHYKKYREANRDKINQRQNELRRLKKDIN